MLDNLKPSTTLYNFFRSCLFWCVVAKSLDSRGCSTTHNPIRPCFVYFDSCWLGVWVAFLLWCVINANTHTKKGCIAEDNAQDAMGDNDARTSVCMPCACRAFMLHLWLSDWKLQFQKACFFAQACIRPQRVARCEKHIQAYQNMQWFAKNAHKCMEMLYLFTCYIENVEHAQMHYVSIKLAMLILKCLQATKLAPCCLPWL